MKVLEKIPSMTIGETVKLWRNAIRLASGGHKPKRRQARRVIEAVNLEWIRRSNQAVSAEKAFEFPKTDAPIGLFPIDSATWQQNGILGYLGYRVGNDGESKNVRRVILREVFRGALPPAFPPPYLSEWGQPNSILRLQKLAESIAAFARNAKRRNDHSLDRAIADWEDDLLFLHDEYYVGKVYFIWPSSKI